MGSTPELYLDPGVMLDEVMCIHFSTIPLKVFLYRESILAKNKWGQCKQQHITP